MAVPNGISGSDVDGLGIVFGNQVQLLVESGAEIQAESRTVQGIVRAPVIKVGQMDAKFPGFGGGMLGEGDVPAVEVAVAIPADIHVGIITFPRSRVAYAHHHGGHVFPQLAFPQRLQPHGEMPVLVGVLSPRLFRPVRTAGNTLVQGAYIGHLNPGEERYVDEIIVSIVFVPASPDERHVPLVQVIPSCHKGAVALHLGCGHVEESCCPVRELRLGRRSHVQAGQEAQKPQQARQCTE